MIRKAKLSEIEEILSITQACGVQMISEGILQWNEHYPHQEAFQRDVMCDELFVILSNSSIIGCITISSEKDTEYKDIDWLTEDDRHYYIHRLAIHPSFQKKGYAKKLMDYAESLALENKITSIRLDTFSRNLRNQRFYENRGYTRLGNIFFPKQSKHPFFCYELIINN